MSSPYNCIGVQLQSYSGVPIGDDSAAKNKTLCAKGGHGAGAKQMPHLSIGPHSQIFGHRDH